MMAKKKAAKRKKKASSTTGNTAARTKKKAKVVSRPAAPAGKKSKSKAAVRSELTSRKSEFPIVGLGASAGGLEALQEFFDKIPKRCEMGFVVVTHQHPGHTSLLPELLASHTEMPVVEASDATKIQANHVYVGPPGGNLAMLNGTLHLIVAEADQSSAGPRAKRPKARGDYRLHLPIDRFLRSLAEDQGERAICIILSGTGTDGTLGLRAIKAESGMAMVQEPGSAKYGGMPSSALATGLADFVGRNRSAAKL